MAAPNPFTISMPRRHSHSADIAQPELAPTTVAGLKRVKDISERTRLAEHMIKTAHTLSTDEKLALHDLARDGRDVLRRVEEVNGRYHGDMAKAGLLVTAGSILVLTTSYLLNGIQSAVSGSGASQLSPAQNPVVGNPSLYLNNALNYGMAGGIGEGVAVVGLTYVMYRTARYFHERHQAETGCNHFRAFLGIIGATLSAVYGSSGGTGIMSNLPSVNAAMQNIGISSQGVPIPTSAFPSLIQQASSAGEGLTTSLVFVGSTVYFAIRGLIDLYRGTKSGTACTENADDTSDVPTAQQATAIPPYAQQ